MEQTKAPGQIVNEFLEAFLHNKISNKKELLFRIEEIKPHVSHAFLDIILIIAALKNGGESEILVLDDVEVAIDKSIAAFILRLNMEGLRTLGSCSGVLSEHTGSQYYVIDGAFLDLFASGAALNIVQELAAELDELEVCIDTDKTSFFEPAICLKFRAGSDDELLVKWEKVTEKLLRSRL